MGLKKESFTKFLFPKNKSGVATEEMPYVSTQLKSVITRAYSLANSFNYPYVGTEHFVYALIESADMAVLKILNRKKIRKKSADLILQSGVGGDPLASIPKIFDLPEMSLSKIKTGRRSATPFLDQFCLNINADAKNRGDSVIGRYHEIERIINILGRKNKNNPVLVGEPGVGKTAIVAGLAQKINTGDIVPNFLNKTSG